jgi:hypothetical protein
LPAGFADRVLISHRGVGAFAPASLSDAVYSFNLAKLSNKIRKFFQLFYKWLKNSDKISFQQAWIHHRTALRFSFLTKR